METIRDQHGNIRTISKSPRLLPMVDTTEALCISQALAVCLIESGAVDREKFIDTLRSFVDHAPHYLTEDLDDRVQSLASTLAAIDVPKKRRNARQ
ncbi:MAG: hypothetical protein CL536_01685 [Alcaligenaceae bacterium]|nr:hypothetical protein [Alcaligenaceae bacterium]